MIKPDRWIRRWGAQGGADPFEANQVNAASYDVRVGGHWICPTRDPQEFEAGEIKLFPGEVVLASTLEYVWINHSLAGWCDPGFEGNITLELQNLGPEPFVLEAGRRIAQLIFISMESEPELAYGEPGSSSHYQGQRGTTRARVD
jgi:deoxycytidine triphosphate deaminase